MSKVYEPGVTVDVEGLHVTSPDIAEKLEKKNISPSLVSSLNQCPAKWLGESFVIRDIIEEEPDNPARRGNLYHKVMEDFFALPGEERTKSKIKEIFDATLASPAFNDLASNSDAVQWLKDAINGYYSMGAKPEKVEVASIKDDKGNDTLGLEVFVKGKIGQAKRDVLGFIDALHVNPKVEDSVIVTDWKTGAKVKRYNSKTKGDEGVAEARQQVLYSMLLEQKNVNVSGARLIYPVAQEVVNVDLSDTAFKNRIIEDVENADAQLDVFIENNTFEYRPSFLCAWCPLAKICTKAQIKPYAKMQEAYSKQPDIEILNKGFILQ